MSQPNFWRLPAALLAAAFFLAPVSAEAQYGSVFINGSSFLQSGTLTNTSALTIDFFQFSLGTPGDGIATWDSGTGGGTASDFLSDPRWFQTVSWSGLSVAGGGGTFNFSGLDIDRIVTLSPLSVTGIGIDADGSTLVNAFVRARFSNGDYAVASLNQTGWRTDQDLDLRLESVSVPEPSSILLFASGLLGLAMVRRNRSSSLHSDA